VAVRVQPVRQCFPINVRRFHTGMHARDIVLAEPPFERLEALGRIGA
jgi:hypothetical protein